MRSTKVSLLVISLFALTLAGPTIVYAQKGLLFDTWISANPSRIAKFAFTMDGQEQLFAAIVQRKPFYSTKIDIIEIKSNEPGTHLYELLEYVLPPYSDSPRPIGFYLAKLSMNNNLLQLAVGTEAFPRSIDKATALISLYRTGSIEASKIREMPSSSKYVIIDRGCKAYLSIYGVSDSKTLSGIVNSPEYKKLNAESYDWDKFLAESIDILNVGIVVDRFHYQTLFPDLIGFLRRTSSPYEGVIQIGLTWNGGIAYTRTDYDTAVSEFDKYCANPEADETSFSPESSPHNPWNQFSYIPH
jgi:hypothetical protein